MPYTAEKIISTLCSVPARDGNFKAALDHATEPQLEEAWRRMTDIVGEPYPGEKSRVRAVRARLRQKRRGRGVPPSEA
jgi:hypothetical protein